MTTADVVILGGGLAGLMAAARTEALGGRPVVVDAGVPGTPGDLGGFAPFSGAKFSLAPAGSGLAPLVGGEEGLIELYGAICHEFADLGLAQFNVSRAELAGEESHRGNDLAFRRYHSILLSPDEIDALLAALAGRLRATTVVRRRATGLDVAGKPFRVNLEGGDAIESPRLILAAGRLGADLLSSAGVPEVPGKGIDVGVRLGFADRAPVAGLRELGPDAKFMSEGVRTFCLNSPGRIFHYPGAGHQLPGGVVAPTDWAESNVGILCRLDDRHGTLRRLLSLAPPPDAMPIVQVGREADLGWTDAHRKLLGHDVARRLDDFVGKLQEERLLQLPDRFDVHLPLLDWYWPVFSLPGRLGTSVDGVLAAGDASGHARGLMQAAAMGRLAAEEASR